MLKGLQSNRPVMVGLIAIIVLLIITGVGVRYGWLPAAGLLLLLAGWGAAAYFRAADRVNRQALAVERAQLRQAAQQRETDERRMEAILRLNRSLLTSPDERSLMNSALSAVTGLVGALGCSFVPVDEWAQPLPAFTFGELPEPVLSAWSTHLASQMLRERCGSCRVLESTPGACPLHPAQLGSTLTVYCLPLSRPLEGVAADAGELASEVTDPLSGRTVGVLHLYLPAGRTLDASTRVFLDGLLNQIALAYEALRLRSQEQVTLRQLQMLRAPENDFTAALGGLLEGVAQVLEADFVLIRLRPSADERLSNLQVLRGDPRDLSAETLDCLVEAALPAALLGRPAASDAETLPAWLALPLALPDAANADAVGVLGAILAVANHPHPFHPRQRAILQTVAAQAALLIENERMLRSLEYKVVIQERARLAREIHDGLAQTLAFLKLQAAQMQSYLAQGDIDRLSQVLKVNYQTLTEAYLDTRQAIDNLRLTPQKGLDSWLERVVSEFESATGLTVERAILPLAHAVSPEVQAQLVRIVQEALSNVRKHARARQVRVSLRERQGEQVLEVSDDGLGFDAADVPEISRHGLRGMRERAEMIGADFQIISQARQGTTVRLVLPVSYQEEPAP